MSLDIIADKGIRIEAQEFNWCDLVRTPANRLGTKVAADPAEPEPPEPRAPKGRVSNVAE